MRMWSSFDCRRPPTGALRMVVAWLAVVFVLV